MIKKTVNDILQRITLLESRGPHNSNIVRKLKRELRRKEK